MKLGLLRNKFLEAIQNYQRVEQEGRIKVRQRAERQVRVGMTGFQVRASPCADCDPVNPDASPEEVNTIVEGGDQQIFAQAVRVKALVRRGVRSFFYFYPS